MGWPLGLSAVLFRRGKTAGDSVAPLFKNSIQLIGAFMIAMNEDESYP